MLTCIACSKHIDDSPEDDTRGATPSTKDAAKSLTAQIKDMALKFSGAYRQCKPCTGSSSSGYKKGGHHHHHHHHYPDFDTASESGQYPYLRAASSSSTPAWDFTNPNFNTNMMGSMNRDGSRPKGIMGGDRTPSSLSYDAVLVEEEEPKEWMAQVEPGVLITFVSLPNGGNDLKRIRFSREMFNKLQAQRWWGENYDRIMELYNVQRFNRQALHTPPRSEDERDPLSRMGSARESPVTLPYHKERTPKSSYRSAGKGYGPSDFPETSHNYNAVPNFSGYGGGSGGVTKAECSSVDASRTTTSSRDEASISISNASEQECEWVEQDEPGVFITIRALPDGTRELRRVRFSRERFGEVHAKLWWEENRERIQAQYL